MDLDDLMAVALSAYHFNCNVEGFLENVTQKMGDVDPDAQVCILFQADVDDDIQLYELPRFLDENHIDVSSGFDDESYACLEFQTFYVYLEPVVMRHYAISKNRPNFYQGLMIN